MHTTTPAPSAQSPIPQEPGFIRRLLVALTVAVLIVAVVANGAAYIGGVAFAQNVMGLTPVTSFIFGGVIELSLAVVAAATFIEAFRMQPTALFRTATWVLSGVSGLFGGLFEIMEYLAGNLTLPAALSAAGWRLFAPFLAAGLWELVIHLFCGGRHRDHRTTERRHILLYRFFKAGEREGLAHGTWLAGIAASRARTAARRIAKDVPQADRDAQLGAWLQSAQFGEHVRISVAAIAARTAHRMRTDLSAQIPAHMTTAHGDAARNASAHSGMQSATVQKEPSARLPVKTTRTALSAQKTTIAARTLATHKTTPVAQAAANAEATATRVAEQVTETQEPQNTTETDYRQRVNTSVQKETASILADIPTPTPKKGNIRERREMVRAFLHGNRDATGESVHRALLAAGYEVKLRTAYTDRDTVLAGMA